MPTINKQRVATVASAAPATTNGNRSPAVESVPGINDLIARSSAVGKLKDDFIKMVLYGQNRTGKTTLACQFEKPLLLLSFEPGQQGGARSVKRFDGVTFIALTKKEDAILLSRHLKVDPRSNWQKVSPTDAAPTRTLKELVLDGSPSWTGSPWRTIVIDTITSLQDVILAELMGLKAVPVQLNWGSVPEGYYAARSEQAKEVMRLYRDLPFHIIFNAKEKDHNPPKSVDAKGRERVVGNRLVRSAQAIMSSANLGTESYFAADVGAATAQWMHDACDYICRLEIVKELKEITQEIEIAGVTETDTRWEETGKLVRRLRCLYHPNVAAGFRAENPEAVPEYISNPTYGKIMSVIRGEKLKDQ